jgi:hypothetical protein
MKNLLLKLFAIILLAGFFHACNETSDSPIDPIDSQLKSGLNTALEKVQDVMDLQDKVTDAFLIIPKLLVVGTGLDENGNPTIVVYTFQKYSNGLMLMFKISAGELIPLLYRYR